jgi:hypothetical protein
MPPLPALLQGKLEDEVTQRWLKESCPGSVFQAMTRTKEKGRGIPSGHAAPIRQSACRVAECGGQRTRSGRADCRGERKSRRLAAFAPNKWNREFESSPLRQRVLSLRILRPKRRNSPRLRPHLHDARHRRKPLSGGSCARRGQSLCWQVRRFHPGRAHDGVDSTTGLIRKCEELIEREPTRRSPQLWLARSRAEGDRSVRPRPRR